MQAIENEPPEPGAENACIAQYRQRGWLQGFVPVPLGEQRERFCALVRDMRQRGDAYTSQLSMLTLAGLNRRDQPESHRSILSTLLHNSAIKEQNDESLLLWQSRLIIKLGEYYDIEQTELRNALHAIERQQNSLLVELCDEAENPFAPAAPLEDSGLEPDRILHHRLKAWTRLCFHAGRQAPGVLVTRHRTAMDLLHEHYEKLWRQSPELLLCLEIPLDGHEQKPDDAPLARQCPNLVALLAAAGAGGSSLHLTPEREHLPQTGLTEWTRCTGDMLSSSQTKRHTLDLYWFPKTTAPQLFSESFGDLISTRDLETDTTTGCVVGLLRTN